MDIKLFGGGILGLALTMYLIKFVAPEPSR